MNSATFVMEGNKISAAHKSVAESEPLFPTESPEISPAAWKIIISMLVGTALFLAAIGAYVFFGLSRFQNCL